MTIPNQKKEKADLALTVTLLLQLRDALTTLSLDLKDYVFDMRSMQGEGAEVRQVNPEE